MESRALLLTLIKNTEEDGQPVVWSVVLGVFDDKKNLVSAYRNAYISLQARGFKPVDEGLFESERYPNYLAFLGEHEPMAPAISGEIIESWIGGVNKKGIEA